MNERVSGVIVKDGKVLLMHRVRDGREYFVFPGGKIEKGESPDAALRREIREETSLEISHHTFLFDVENMGRAEHFFLVDGFSGTPAIIGEELGRMSPTNVYELVWFPLRDALARENLVPSEARMKLLEEPALLSGS